jgi:KaiC/GvpD/RAD55 family RecA-like ATPase
MFVFVLDSRKKHLNPTHPARARKLLKMGKAAVFKRYPFTIILKEEVVELNNQEQGTKNSKIRSFLTLNNV